MRSPVQQQAARGGPAGSSVPGFFLAGGNRAHSLALVIKKADGGLAVWRDLQRQARRAAGIAQVHHGAAVEIGRASCRERGSSSVAGVPDEKTTQERTH